jgi:DNA-binding protein, ybaB/ebfC family
MFDGLDFSKMGQMLEEVQKKAREIENESQAKEFVVKAGGGLISVKANGKGEIIDISIDDSLMDDKDSLQILLISGINDVIKMVEDNKKSMATNLLGGLGGLNFGDLGVK